jgi:DNA-binding PadR family transcriptional regulator
VAPSPPSADKFRRRVVGLYALSLMDREGPVHGYRLSDAIAERTEGTWRPGPGAVYPSLQKLVEGGLARRRVEGRRRVYSITPQGTALLRRMRENRRDRWGGQRDLGRLWSEVLGVKGLGEFHRLRLRRSIDAIEEHLASGDLALEDAARLRREVADELSAALDRIRSVPLRAARSPARSARSG